MYYNWETTEEQEPTQKLKKEGDIKNKNQPVRKRFRGYIQWILHGKTTPSQINNIINNCILRAEDIFIFQD